MPSTDHKTRDLIGYGPNVPDAKWPGGAKICVSFVVNYEEGGEHTLLNGDNCSEAFLTEGGATGGSRPGRNLGVESGYEYGSRRGFWRILNLFKSKGAVFTSWAIGRAVEQNPRVVDEIENAGCEVASHSYRWIDYWETPEDVEREHVDKTVEAIRSASSRDTIPLGWYTGRQSLATRRVVYEAYRKLGLLDKYYDSDAYDDDVPYWVPSPSPSETEPSPPLLVIPYTLDNNDMKFAQAPGFQGPTAFFEYLKNAFDTLYSEGEGGEPKMMSVGLHCRVVGRPGRLPGLANFIDYIQKKEGVWIATRSQIADHWRKVNPAPADLPKNN